MAPRPSAVPHGSDWLAGAEAVTPDSADAVSEILTAATHDQRAIVTRGNGTKIGWGNAPDRCDLVLDTRNLTSVDHAAGDLVAQVEAGVTLKHLQDTLARRGQRLTADPPVPGGTVGGMVATGLSGPTRLAHGAVRDLIIGMTVVRADGVVARTGGRVVKNVAGYDLGKLHAGALGTLGVITSVTFRLHPLPEARRVVTATANAHSTVERWLRGIRRSQVVPAAVEIDTDLAAPTSVAVQALVEGAEGGIDARAEALAREMTAAHITDTLPESWGLLPGEEPDTLLRLTTPPDETAAVAQALADLCRSVGASARLRGSAGAGTLHAALAADTPHDAVLWLVDRLRQELVARGGHATVPRPSAATRAEGLDLWGEVPGLDLMRSVKKRFDPDRRLAPGRFAGGI